MTKKVLSARKTQWATKDSGASAGMLRDCRRPRLSKWVQILKVTLAKALREQGDTGPFWQKGFFDHVLRSAESYRLKWEYVRRNPVRAGLVNRPEEWPYQGEVFQLGWDL